MGSSKKRRTGATPAEVLLLIAKAEEKIAKNTKEETKAENNKTGHCKVTECKEGKDIAAVAVEVQEKAEAKNGAKNKDAIKEKAHTKPVKKVKDKSSKNIKRGASPEEMLQLIAKGEERSAKEAKEKESIENINIAKTEDGLTTEGRKQQSFDTPPPVETNKSFMQISQCRSHSKFTKIKVAVFLILATLAATALTFGLSIVNFPSGVVREALIIPEQAQLETIDFRANDTDLNNDTDIHNETNINNETFKVYPLQPKKAVLTIDKGYYQRNRETLTTGDNLNLIQSSDNNRWDINFGSYTSFDFSDISIPTDALIKSVIVFVEHFEEKRFVQGKLEWSIGTGWPNNPVVWASIIAPVKKGEFDEAVDSWDITSLVNTCEKINSLQLQIKNNNIADSKTLIDYIYVAVRWD